MFNDLAENPHMVSFTNLSAATSLDPDDPTHDPPPEVTRKLLADVSHGRIQRDDADHIRSVIRRVSALTGSKVKVARSRSTLLASPGAGLGSSNGSVDRGTGVLELVKQNLDPVVRPMAYRYFHEEFVFMQVWYDHGKR